MALIQINLLPSAAKPSALPSARELVRMPLTWIVAAAMAASVGLGWFSGFTAAVRLAGLKRHIAQLEPKKAELDTLQQFVERLRAQEEAFRGLRSEDRHRWSMRLQELSEATPDGVWFSDLDMDAGKGLVIRGSALGEGGNEMAHITKLVDQLKATPNFKAAVGDLQIESVKARDDGGIDLADFTLTGAAGARGGPEGPPWVGGPGS
jgi:Tfp pilus assembly protein PilN